LWLRVRQTVINKHTVLKTKYGSACRVHIPQADLPGAFVEIEQPNMQGDLYYYISALPALGDLDGEPPMKPAQLLEHLDGRPAAQSLLETLFLLDDLLQREAFLAGELTEVSPQVLTIQQVRNEAALPNYLLSDTEESSEAMQGDRCWEAFFRYAANVAKRRSNELLRAWVGYEVALRNALATARAERLGLEASDYHVAYDLADHEADFTQALNEWSSAPTPLAGLKVLMATRWAWLTEHEAWFSFRDDELGAYAAKLLLQRQWRRIAQADSGQMNNESSGSLERATP